MGAHSSDDRPLGAALAADLRRTLVGGVAEDAGTLGKYAGSPLVAVRPAGSRDVAAVLRYAAERRLPVAPHGAGGSTGGRAGGGIALDMSGLIRLQVDAGARKFWAGAGVPWSSVVAAAVPHGLAPPVLTGSPADTVGGSMSAGGWGPTSFRSGAQVDSCLGVEVVTVTGEVLRCDGLQNPELFAHVLAGMGQFAVITAVEARLRTLRPATRLYPLEYDDLPSLLADAASLVQSGTPLHALEAGGPPYRMTAAIEGAEDDLFPDSCPGASPARAGAPRDVSSARRLTRSWDLPAENLWHASFLPVSKAAAYVESALAVLPGAVRLWPARRGSTGVPMLRTPDEDFVLVGLVPSELPEEKVLGRLSDQALGVGGTRLLASWVWLDTARWRLQFGPLWPVVNRLKERHDPAGVLNPGFIEYEPGYIPFWRP